jgi:hypothetical protein
VAGWLAGGLAGWLLLGWVTGCWLAGWLAAGWLLAGRLAGWLLAGWPAGLASGWLAGWLRLLRFLARLQLRCALLRFATISYALLRFATLCYAALFATLCYALLRFATLYYVLLRFIRFATLCYALLRFCSEIRASINATRSLQHTLFLCVGHALLHILSASLLACFVAACVWTGGLPLRENITNS